MCSKWRTEGQIRPKCKETSNLMWLSLIWYILFHFCLFVETYFAQYQTSESDVWLKPKMFLFCFRKILNQAFLHDSHIWFWRFLYILGCSGPWCAANTGGGGGGNGARNKEQADLPFLHVMWEWEMQERHFQHILRKKIILILVTLGRVRAEVRTTEPLKVGRDATYFNFDLSQHSVRRFTPLVSAGITTQCTIWRKNLFVFR